MGRRFRRALSLALLTGVLVAASPATAGRWRLDSARQTGQADGAGWLDLATALRQLWTGLSGVWAEAGAEVGPNG